MTKADFHDWKRHPVTQQVFSQLQGLIDNLTEEIVFQTAHVAQAQLAEKAGMIRAFRDVLLVDYTEETQ